MERLRSTVGQGELIVRILITGGAGFKGCVLSELLLARGHEVSVFDRMTYGEAPAMGLLRRGVRVVRGDVTRFDQIAPEVATHDAVVHLAALVGFHSASQSQ